MRSGGQDARPFLWLALLVLGGGLFAAGVMVGRHSVLPKTPKPDPLAHIDARDHGPAGTPDELTFPKELSSPRPKSPGASRAKPVKEEPSKPEPVKAAASKPESLKAGASKPESPAGSAGSTCLQVASFRELQQAQSLVDKLKSAGFKQVRSVAGDVPGKGIYHRVRLGAYSDVDAAQADSERLKRELNLNCLVMICEE